MNWGPGAAEPIHVNVPSRAALLGDITKRLNAGQGFSVATLNLDHVVKLKRDPLFRAAYRAHSHVTADGNPIIRLLKISGQEDIALVTGADLVEPVVAQATDQGWPIGFLGSTQASLQGATERLQATYPALNVPFIEAPAMGFDPDGAEAGRMIKAIGDSGAQIIFLALGAPKQERFAARAQQELPGVGFFSVGAGVDFISGHQTRAPGWVRALKIEWIWRMAQNPGRLVKRYADCLAALPGLTIAAIRHRRGT